MSRCRLSGKIQSYAEGFATFLISGFLFILNRYGVSDHALTHKLVEHARQLPPSFDPIAPREYDSKTK